MPRVSKLTAAQRHALLGLLGVVLLVAGLGLHTWERRWVSRAHQVEGVVVDFDCHTDEGTELCAPVAEFVIGDGLPRRVTYSVSSSSPSHTLDEPVQIAYDPQDPDDAAFVAFADLWFGSFVLIVGSLAVLGWILTRRLDLQQIEPQPRWLFRVPAGVLGAFSYFAMVELLGPDTEAAAHTIAWGWIATVVVAVATISACASRIPKGRRRDGVLAGAYGLLVLPLSVGIATLLLPRSLWAGALAAAPVLGGLLVPAYIRFATALEGHLQLRRAFEDRVERALAGDGAEILVEVTGETSEGVAGTWRRGDEREDIHLARSVFQPAPVVVGVAYLVLGAGFDERPGEGPGYREMTTEDWIERATSVRRADEYPPAAPIPWGVLAMAVLLPIGLTMAGAWLVTVPQLAS